MEYGPCEGDHAEEEILKRKKGVVKISYRLIVTNLNPLLAQQLFAPKIGKVNGNEVKENFTISPTRLTGFCEKVHVGHYKKGNETADLHSCQDVVR